MQNVLCAQLAFMSVNKKNLADNYVALFSIVLSIAIHLYLTYLRNEWYADFYSAIQNKSSLVSSITYFLILASLIALNDVFKGMARVRFIAKRRYEGISMLLKIQAPSDFAQRVSEDKRLQAENFISAVDYFVLGVGTICVFIPRLFYLIGAHAIFVVFLLCIYSSIVFILNFGYLKNNLQVSFYKYEESEASFRKFLSSWYNKRCVKPIKFASTMLTLSRLSMQRFYWMKIFVDNLRNFYESVGLIIPFAIFYSFYCVGQIEFARFIQLINLWVQVNFGVIILAKGCESYINADTSRHRLNIEPTHYLHGDSLKLENVSMFSKKRKIIENFSCELKLGDKVNIVAENGVGKTSLMQAMQKMRAYSGIISVPENIIWIPEQPILPDKMSFQEVFGNDDERFKANCAFMEVDSQLLVEGASGSEKWRLIAAYAMLFDFIVWDDPFWGLDARVQLQRVLPRFRSALIFSQCEIDGMKHVVL